METFQVGSEEAARRYESHNIRFMRPFVEAILDSVKAHPGESLLDVACGTGLVTRSAVGRGIKATGTDLNPGMLRIARELDATISWIPAPADALPFDDDSFDIVTCQQGMQFFPDAVAAAREMNRVATRVAATVWASLDLNPYFRVQYEALTTFIDPASGEGVKAGVSRDKDFLGTTFERAGLVDIEAQLVEHNIELPPIGAWAGEQIGGTPWGNAYASASESAKQEFGDYFEEHLAEYDNAIPFTSWLVTARRP